jgi:hypothetical protein
MEMIRSRQDKIIKVEEHQLEIAELKGVEDE